MYVYIYICVCVCIYVYIYICIIAQATLREVQGVVEALCARANALQVGQSVSFRFQGLGCVQLRK
jgi:hypothetical protein